MTGALIGGLGTLLGKLFGTYEEEKQEATLDTGINYEKAAESGDALKSAADAQVISGDTDRMSDDSVRKSPYANNRDD